MIVLSSIAAVALVASNPAVDEAAIMAAMTESAAGWNAGSLDRFVAVYAEDATYVITRGLVRGRAAIAARYAPSFAAGGNTRGRLSFERLGFRAVSPTHAVLFARWTLTPVAGKGETGLTTLVFQRQPAGWRIVADHSS